MSTKISELDTLLRHEIVLCNKFLALIENKKEEIIANNIERISTITKEENETLDQIEELGFNRQELVLAISNQPNFRPTEHLKDLLKQLPEDIKAPLVELRTRLYDIYEKITDHSKLNAELLAQSIGLTQHLFKRISNTDNRLRNSGNYGRFNHKKKKTVIAPVKSLTENKG